MKPNLAETDPRSAATHRPEAAQQDYIPFLYGQVYRLHARAIERALRPELREAEWRVLVVLSMGEGCRVGDLSARTVIERTTLSRLLDAMERRGLVRREAEATDGRVARIFRTEAGIVAFDAAAPKVRGINDAMIAAINADDIATLKTTLRRMGANLQRLSAPSPETE